MQWFLCFLPVGVILLIIAPWLSYVLYKPEITHSEEVATWAGDELKTMGALTRREWTLIGLVLLSLGLWVFGSEVINATAVGLLAILLTNSRPSTFGAAPVTNMDELRLVLMTIIHIK
ncbi:anion permease [Escherichia sp. R-CC3]